MENLTLHKMLNTWQTKVGLRVVNYTEGGVSRDDFITTDLLNAYRLPVNKIFLMVENVGGKLEYRIMKVLQNHRRFIVFECTPIPVLGYRPRGYNPSYTTSVMKLDLIRLNGEKTDEGILQNVKSTALCFMPAADELRRLCEVA